MRRPLVALCTVLSLAACDVDFNDDPIEVTSYNIIGGAPDAGHPAVGAVVVSAGYLCTGTLVSSRVVLTGAHCVVQGVAPDKFALGPATDAATEIHNITQCIPHPQYGPGVIENVQVNLHDIMVCVLATPAAAAPMKLRTSSIDGLYGTSITFVGFGVTVPGNAATTGTKMAVSVPIGKIDAQGFFNTTTPTNPKNTCTGDSGGPAVLHTGGLDEVIGVTSQGDAGCVESGWNIRVDLHAAWIQQMIQTHDPSGGDYCGDGECGPGENHGACPADCTAANCGAVTYNGCCDGELLQYCDGGALQMIHCGTNPACGWNSTGGYFDCGTDGGMDPSGANPKACGVGPVGPVCGDGICAPTEDELTCPADCEVPPVGPVCGDGICDRAEQCPADCDSDPRRGPICGDGICHAGEDCPADCYFLEGSCGNGICDPGEECGACVQDCGFCIEDDEGGGGGCGAAGGSPGHLWILVLAALSLRRRSRARPV